MNKKYSFAYLFILLSVFAFPLEPMIGTLNQQGVSFTSRGRVVIASD